MYLCRNAYVLESGAGSRIRGIAAQVLNSRAKNGKLAAVVAAASSASNVSSGASVSSSGALISRRVEEEDIWGAEFDYRYDPLVSLYLFLLVLGSIIFLAREGRRLARHSWAARASR